MSRIFFLSGMINSGMGPSHVNSFLTACDIPPIDHKTIAKKENIIGDIIEKEAQKSCTRSLQKEVQMSDTLECSYDAGWQTRGAGWNYNSISGHGTLIGKQTGKILQYEIRSKSCSVCDHHGEGVIPVHQCSKNWDGSSKAMEPDMAVSMLHKMKDCGHPVQVIHADNDSTTLSTLKLDFPELQKKDDKNHIKKGISKKLYALAAKWKELKSQSSVIPYLVRCFMYTLSRARTSDDVREGLSQIVPHVFGDHAMCSDWCTFKKDPDFRFKHLPNGQQLKADGLRQALEEMVETYKKRADQLVNMGSTQSNENFNFVVSSKAPKNRCYGRSRSLTHRVSAAVLQKNEGHTWINKVCQTASLSPGHYSNILGKRLDRKRLWQNTRQKLIKTKKRRLELKKKKSSAASLSTVREGTIYSENIELSSSEVNTCIIPSSPKLKGTENFIHFDLETTGLERTSDIVQLSAVCGTTVMNRYVMPRKKMSLAASKVTGIRVSLHDNQMFCKGEKVESVTIQTALLDFIEFLKGFENPVLVGHNILSFDIPVLLHKLSEFHLKKEFLSTVHLCIDTLKLARRLFKKDIVGNYKQQTLVSVLLNKEYAAHDAKEDVMLLQELFLGVLKDKLSKNDLCSIDFKDLFATLTPLVENKCVSSVNARKLAQQGIGLFHLQIAEQRDSSSGIETILIGASLSRKAALKICQYLKREQ
ncbi:uncharacterized protein LOC134261526 [Saccostrea cucullata]|uniref:uncharacterized protein LOC134261526 n=1 Tax=Saccostrea cuccullata TaxID=36930 RepID=UPI002ED1718B